jgi:hypothetical protein
LRLNIPHRGKSEVNPLLLIAEMFSGHMESADIFWNDPIQFRLIEGCNLEV